jgi:hypothetical protein
MDAQIWYMFISAIVGGLDGAGKRLGEVSTKLEEKTKLILSFGNYLLSLLQVVRENLEHTRNLTHLR